MGDLNDKKLNCEIKEKKIQNMHLAFSLSSVGNNDFKAELPLTSLDLVITRIKITRWLKLKKKVPSCYQIEISHVK